MYWDTCAEKKVLCQPEDTLCAPCGEELLGPSVALTFSYDFFDAVLLHTEYEVRLSFLPVHKRLAGNACQPDATCALPTAYCFAEALPPQSGPCNSCSAIAAVPAGPYGELCGGPAQPGSGCGCGSH